MKRKQLTLVEFWYCFWGKCYVVNHNSKEIHSLYSKHVNCFTWVIKNKQYVTEDTALNLIAEQGYNGCRWCWPDEDLG